MLILTDLTSLESQNVILSNLTYSRFSVCNLTLTQLDEVCRKNRGNREDENLNQQNNTPLISRHFQANYTNIF